MPLFDETMFEINYQFISPKQDKPIPDLVWDLWIIPASPSCYNMTPLSQLSAVS